jgi:hypothetical protein
LGLVKPAVQTITGDNFVVPLAIDPARKKQRLSSWEAST